MIATNTGVLNSIGKLSRKAVADHPSTQRGLQNQVSLLTLMVGNLAEKSLALAAILTATCRATAL